MIINFVGAFNQPGYVGEISDETHLARELETVGHTVRRLPRDEWREHVISGDPYANIPEDVRADINIIAKWHHFYDESFVTKLKEKSGAPVFYWVWDFMWDQGFPEWHIKMAQAADLYLSGEEGIKDRYKALGIKHYYFQFDVCDGSVLRSSTLPKKYNVVFTGSKLGQGHRIEWLKKINQEVPVEIFAWNHEEWVKEGFQAHPAVYGEEYNRVIEQSKIILGFSVEPYCWGYWSNRVGKVLRANGFLLQEYAPGMELFLGNKAEYFSSPEEAIEKINKYKDDSYARSRFTFRSRDDQDSFTSQRKVEQLSILMDRYLKGDPNKWLL